MRFLTTLLTATVLCASMLAIAAHRAGDLPEPERWAVTTVTADRNAIAEVVLGHGERLDRAALGELSGAASRPGPVLASPDEHQG
ncbi:hypothetical protein OKC48_07550 [Methylorubrum extorquens]|uniref:hypothetical protein n=1 Tax=Methylorubrum extorquens TaxID=408 RepID=UPI002237FFA3|nr:hypothetical protein [Methylorubrum extorquens]UYW28360.1 hypothetical protein OKC48_07550 [Methylorubrum extorquens]